jgi:hypothetical protein
LREHSFNVNWRCLDGVLTHKKLIVIRMENPATAKMIDQELDMENRE